MLRLYFYPELICSIQDETGQYLFSARRKKDGAKPQLEVLDTHSFQAYDIFLHGFRVRWDGEFAMPYVAVETFGMLMIPESAVELTIVPKAFAFATVVEKFEGGQPACRFARHAHLIEIAGVARRVGGGLVNLTLTAKHEWQEGTKVVPKGKNLLSTLRVCYWYFAGNDMRVVADASNIDINLIVGSCWTNCIMIDSPDAVIT